MNKQLRFFLFKPNLGDVKDWMRNNPANPDWGIIGNVLWPYRSWPDDCSLRRAEEQFYNLPADEMELDSNTRKMLKYSELDPYRHLRTGRRWQNVCYAITWPIAVSKSVYPDRWVREWIKYLLHMEEN